MEYFKLTLITFAVVIGARGFHAAWMNRGKVIKQKYKGLIGLFEYLVLAILAYNIDFSSVVSAAPLFLGARLFSDYLLNIARGLPFHYIPERPETPEGREIQNEYLAFTDSLLRRVKPPTRLAIRIIILVLSGLLSYFLFIHINHV